MKTNTKVNAPLEDQELETVNGGSFLSDIGLGAVFGLLGSGGLAWGYSEADRRLPWSYQELNH